MSKNPHERKRREKLAEQRRRERESEPLAYMGEKYKKDKLVPSWILLSASPDFHFFEFPCRATGLAGSYFLGFLILVVSPSANHFPNAVRTIGFRVGQLVGRFFGLVDGSNHRRFSGAGNCPVTKWRANEGFFSARHRRKLSGPRLTSKAAFLPTRRTF